MGEASTGEVEDTSILLTELDPRVFYSVMVDAIIQDALPTLTGPRKSVYMHVHSIQFHAFIMQILGTIEVIVIRIYGCLCAEYSLVCMHVFTLVWCLIILAGLFSSCMQTATNAPLGVGTFFGGVVAGVVSVVLFEACVLGVVKWRQRLKEPAASKQKEGVRFVLTSNIIILFFRNWHCLPL